MTECERIVKQGILPESFFDEEMICDFFVDKKRKKIWAIELDLLIKFDQVCKKYGLQYFLAFGSLLGGVRHHGFIPWDDDLDVMMPRKDYEYIMQLANEFSEPYFLQTPYTDEGYYYSCNKLRNSNTTEISIPFLYERWNQGIPIDIFPLDNCVLEENDLRYHKINELIMDNSTYMRMSNPNLEKDDLKRIGEHSGRNPLEVYEEMNTILCQYNDWKTGMVGPLACTIYSFKKTKYFLEDLEESIPWDYEGYLFPVPKGYKRILEITYGDYMVFPPKEQRGEWHNNAIFEPDIPYKEYIREFIK